MRVGLLICICLTSLAGMLHADTRETVKTSGKVSQATLYRNQALITRTVDLSEIKVGTTEVIVEDLPNKLCPTVCSPKVQKPSKSVAFNFDNAPSGNHLAKKSGKFKPN